MRSIHVHIPDEDYVFLKETAAATGLKMAALVRFALAQAFPANARPLELDGDRAAESDVPVELLRRATREAQPRPEEKDVGHGDAANGSSGAEDGAAAVRLRTRPPLGFEVIVRALDPDGEFVIVWHEDQPTVRSTDVENGFPDEPSRTTERAPAVVYVARRAPAKNGRQQAVRAPP